MLARIAIKFSLACVFVSILNINALEWQEPSPRTARFGKKSILFFELEPGDISYGLLQGLSRSWLEERSRGRGAFLVCAHVTLYRY